MDEKILTRSGMGGGLITAHTVLRTRRYTVDWKRMEREFPEINHFPDPSQQWDHLVSLMGPQGVDDPAMWKQINKCRKKERRGWRFVRDKVVTTAFVDFVIDQLQTETSAFGDFKYHDSGTGTTAEAVGQTALVTSTAEARSTGTQTETDHDTYKSVATDTYAGSFALREHGLLNAASAGVLMDRTLFGEINVVSGNQVEFTFEFSMAAGG